MVFSSMNRQRDYMGPVVAGLLVLSSIAAQAQPAATTIQHSSDLGRLAQSTMKGTPSLDELVGQNFFQIPLAEQRRLGIHRDAYIQVYAEPIARWLEMHRNILEGELRKRFDGLNYEAMAKRRADGQPIQYCSWIPGARVDGLLPNRGDFLTRFRQACREFALVAIDRMTREKFEKTGTSLSLIRTLEDDFPRWLVADLAMAIENGPNFDGLAYDARYRAEMERRLLSQLPGMIQTVERHFASLPSPNFPLPHPATLCRELLGEAFRLSGFGKPTSEALKGTCLSEARQWAKRFEAPITEALRNAIQRDRKVRLLTTASLICQQASAEVLGDGALLDATLRKSLDTQCLALARTEETELLEHHVARALASINRNASAIILLRKTRWLTMEATDQRAFIDPRAQTDLTLIKRFAEGLETQLRPWRIAAVDALERDIRSQFDKSLRSSEAFHQARYVCVEIRAVASNVPTIVHELAARVLQTCLGAEQALLKAVIEKAFAASGVDQLNGKTLIVGAAAFDPKALVAASAIAGRNVRFSRDWWGNEWTLRVTSSFGGSSSMEGRFRTTTTPARLELVSFDPIPGYSADPSEIASCLFRSPDQEDRIAIHILQTMHSLLDGLRLAFVHEVVREQCEKALRATFP